jgi:hypothetical protein
MLFCEDMEPVGHGMCREKQMGRDKISALLNVKHG